ncbi:unnamed protein product [Meloidogyne enterolobii]|uniref:Uncharacterized protein n=1 Tax=Meloidogyne enterolobii TaxID=390850 RepID=A0ACB0YTX3_MELEN
MKIFPPNKNSFFIISFNFLSIISNKYLDAIGASSHTKISVFFISSASLLFSSIFEIEFFLMFKGNLNLLCKVLPFCNCIAAIPVKAILQIFLFKLLDK